ncbi:MAG: hypothetical protein H0X47_07965 [Nitrospirales bacterium]|nr:hypothetical protein [Nitrospirales bacterium]
MNSVFLVRSLRTQDQERERMLVGAVESLIESQNVRIRTGENLAGEAVTPECERRIKEADGLIALLTRRESSGNGDWSTHQFVRDELLIARNAGKMGISVVEDGVKMEGAYQNHNFIPYNSADPLPTFVKLTQAISEWIRQSGRSVKVQILPQDVVKKISNDAKVSYCLHRDGNPPQWQEVLPFTEVGAIFIQVKGVHDNAMVQLQIEHSGRIWKSLPTPIYEWMQIEIPQGDNQ